MTERLGVEVIDFDTHHADMVTARNTIQNALTKYQVTLMPPNSIMTRPSDWDGFVRAVTGSTAQIVVVTVHGAVDDEISPTPSEQPCHWRKIADVFPPGSITAPTLLLFSCEQWHHRAAWRRAAPSSRLVLCDDIVHGVAHVLEHVVQVLLGESSPRKLQQKWHVIDP